jgi:diketogulonate reductase-like aldo/keto reductase
LDQFSDSVFFGTLLDVYFLCLKWTASEPHRTTFRRLAKGKECYQSCLWALEAGYRHIDSAELCGFFIPRKLLDCLPELQTASCYSQRPDGNEKEVAQAIKDSGIPRSEIYITTKVWNSSQGLMETISACKDSLKKLNTDYIDLYLIHSPQEGTRKDTWLAMEQLQKDGLVKSIGVSNYGVHHLKYVCLGSLALEGSLTAF